MAKEKYIQEDSISLRELLLRIAALVNYVLHKWKIIALVVVVGGVLGYLYTLRKPTYTAQTTFALEESSSLSQISGLASSLGLSLGSLGGDEEGLFKGENILELYRSKRMLVETLLTEVKHNGSKERLINTFGRESKWDKSWQSKSYLKGLSFDVDRSQFTASHDSILIEVVEQLKKSYITVDKPSRRLNIISVQVNSKDPFFSAAFDTTLVKKVSDFYLYSKTRKTTETVATLQHQADSVKKVLDSSVLDIATNLERTLNYNVLNRKQNVPIQQKQMDLQSSFAAYSEIVKNLELAKLNHLDRQPLIQIIDRPMRHLENNKWRWYKGLVVGMFVSGLLSTGFFVVKFFFAHALQAR
ncbi:MULTISPECIES: exopolysaccharide biosynthesis protein [unclassified Imperialibacter]|uniref:exopolysaccharide biosynthesis protein n=1 Tax=unclassified Imperialibacter TaxID=2629706 RepID=UPI001253C8DD|nr:MULTISPECIES: exopolysaccharide biosynthesis protein [unclassified Imperialibacter]CAD5267908.1 Exopolysaccharide biosynthesis protein [Imperialibacter sp. 89]CAD5296364.1 Exopolysaccharide biosynthesis protein [Imperialibacter sp. 75]VVT33790.1 Exopolysaccharide biosynthesis protein [Imperialibacter sp. EC-SDR9]